jgi:hypothetical protein
MFDQQRSSGSTEYWLQSQRLLTGWTTEYRTTTDQNQTRLKQNRLQSQSLVAAWMFDQQRSSGSTEYRLQSQRLLTGWTTEYRTTTDQNQTRLQRRKRNILLIQKQNPRVYLHRLVPAWMLCY